MTIKEIKEKGLLLLECISGSKSYGLSTLTSDTDIKGVYYLPKEDFYTLNYIEQISNETNDEVYYELGRFVDLLIKNNPNILELLATPKDYILYKHPLMDYLTMDLFLSKLSKDTFAGYAITQIRKAKGLKKKIVNPIPEERKSILDFCYILEGYNTVKLTDWLEKKKYFQDRCGLINIPHSKGIYALFYDIDFKFKYKGIASSDISNELLLSSIPKEEKEIAYLVFNPDNYSSYCKEYREYWDWVKKRNQERYKGNREHGKNYDAKNMMHTIRLLQVANEILTTGKLNILRKNREELLAIKNGNWDYEDLLLLSNQLIDSIESNYIKSSLPNLPNKDEALKRLFYMRNILYHNKT